MPKLFIISGCNGSGKTTASYTLLPDLLGCREFVNSDEFAKSLSPFDPSAASITASRYMLMKINYLLGRFEKRLWQLVTRVSAGFGKLRYNVN